jgi:cysteine-rich repeat protein
MMVALVRGFLATAAIGWCSATAALAAVDMSGAWFLRGSEPVNEYAFDCHLSVTQTGTSLTIQGVGCPYISAFVGFGTIDVDTGVFSASSPPWGFCSNGLSVTGSTNSTSTEFTATYSCDTGSNVFVGPLEGSRCGNGVLDAGEACDDGDQSALDCCSPTCTFDASGAACTDGDPCTSDTCDGAGTCELVPSEGTPCDDDDNGCTDDVCDASGVCQHVANADPCDDGDDCTLDDVCSGGSCTGGTCSPCCDPLAGCVPAPASGCKEPVSPHGLLEYASLTGVPHTLRWNWRNGEATTPAELGDPKTSTSYAVCIYRRIGTTQDLGLVLAAEAPAGATSGARPSWSVRKSGAIKFKNRDGNADGLTEISIRPGNSGRPRIKVRGEGGGLHLNPIDGTLPVIAQLRASNGTCFEASFSRRLRDAVVVFGDAFDPPFAIDFLSKDAP